jgi:hypothetical protein
VHPADLANASVVAAAVRFDIALFLGAGRYATDTAATLDEARVKAARLAASNPNGRRPLIYGVTADGRSGLVTDALISKTNQTKTELTTMTKAKAKKTAAKTTAKPAAKAAGANIDAIKRKAVAAAKGAQKANGKPAAANGAKRPLGMRARIEADAMAGKLPSPPDFSAETHKRFRPKLAELVAFAKAGKIAELRKYEINPISSSPKAMARYRDLCVIALSAKTK